MDHFYDIPICVWSRRYVLRNSLVAIVCFDGSRTVAARHMRELVEQMKVLGQSTDDVVTSDGLQLDSAVHGAMGSVEFPSEHFGAV